jgi:hypothetical protein
MSTIERNCKKSGWLSGVALLVAAGLLVASARTMAQSAGEGETRTIAGTVKQPTTAPRGEIDGAVLEDGTVIHWPPHLEERFKNLAAQGERVRVTGRMETGPKGDTHFEVATLTNLRTKTSADNDAPPPPRGPRGKREKRGPRPQPERVAGAETRTVTGKVTDATTAPRGEIDGAILDDGTVIHWPPHLQERFKDLATRGARVRVTGWMETGRRGDTHLEVRSVTNLRTNVSRNRGDEGPPVAAAVPADREQRLRDLERQMEQLRREIERLRREK